MPAIIEPVCGHCGRSTSVVFYRDGSVAEEHPCACGHGKKRSFDFGLAYMRHHFFALRVIGQARRLSKCAAELWDRQAGGKCLCDACHEHMEFLDRALEDLGHHMEVPQSTTAS